MADVTIKFNNNVNLNVNKKFLKYVGKKLYYFWSVVEEEELPNFKDTGVHKFNKEIDPVTRQKRGYYECTVVKRAPKPKDQVNLSLIMNTSKTSNENLKRKYEKCSAENIQLKKIVKSKDKEITQLKYENAKLTNYLKTCAINYGGEVNVNSNKKNCIPEQQSNTNSNLFECGDEGDVIRLEEDCAIEKKSYVEIMNNAMSTDRNFINSMMKLLWTEDEFKEACMQKSARRHLSTVRLKFLDGSYLTL